MPLTQRFLVSTHSGYNYPNPFSANTGFETGGVGLLYFVVDESEALSLVLTLDKPNSGNAGGNMVLRVDSPDIVPERVGAQVWTTGSGCQLEHTQRLLRALFVLSISHPAQGEYFASR